MIKTWLFWVAMRVLFFGAAWIAYGGELWGDLIVICSLLHFVVLADAEEERCRSLIRQTAELERMIGDELNRRRR